MGAFGFELMDPGQRTGGR